MRQSTIALLLVLACTLIAAWFFSTHEKVTTTEYTGYRGEARFNDFLAAQMLMSSLGYDAYSRSSLVPSKWLPDTDDALVTRLSSIYSVGVERDLLVEWVAGGGHLILFASSYESRGVDDFLENLGISVVRIAADDGAEDEAEAKDEDDADDDDYDYVIDLDNTLFRIQVSEHASAGATLSDEDGVVALRRELGTGFVTVFAAEHWFTNSAIGDFDHARLFMDAAAGYLEPNKVWFIYDTAFPSLWEVIWTSARYVVIGLAIMLLLWLWSIMPKFGPAIHAAAPARRSIKEHVDAAGHFVWRHDGAAALAGSAAAAVMHAAEYRHPGISRLPLQKQAERIAGITGLSAATILDVLMDQAEPRHREFTRNMQTLQGIRQAL